MSYRTNESEGLERSTENECYEYILNGGKNTLTKDMHLNETTRTSAGLPAALFSFIAVLLRYLSAPIEVLELFSSPLIYSGVVGHVGYEYILNHTHVPKIHRETFCLPQV